MIYLLVLILFSIFFAMIGYPISMVILSKIFNKNKNMKKINFEPSTTVLVVAHNEEKIIRRKLENIIYSDYPQEKLKIIVSSDHSTDRTNQIVREFIKSNKQFDITLYEVTERKGKTNAQNEAQKLVTTEYLIMTDANSLFEVNAIKELLSSFYSPDIYYVCGQLMYTNDLSTTISGSENTYWNMDLFIRGIESDFQTITAGNGAIYACKNVNYIVCKPIESHDSSMPFAYALKGKRALYNQDAIAYEKAGETIEDEFARKVRMNRIILSSILSTRKILNFFEYRWFTYFYLGHRTMRYLLWFNHLFLFIVSMFLVNKSIYYSLFFLFQCLFYILGFFAYKFKWRNKICRMISYYCVTLIAQIFGITNTIIGRSTPIWEKAESTR